MVFLVYYCLDTDPDSVSLRTMLFVRCIRYKFKRKRGSKKGTEKTQIFTIENVFLNLNENSIVYSYNFFISKDTFNHTFNHTTLALQVPLITFNIRTDDALNI